MGHGKSIFFYIVTIHYIILRIYFIKYKAIQSYDKNVILFFPREF